jgi:hypothetical protein
LNSQGKSRSDEPENERHNFLLHSIHDATVEASSIGACAKCQSGA